jgi:hypothetical protein
MKVLDIILFRCAALPLVEIVLLPLARVTKLHG